MHPPSNEKAVAGLGTTPCFIRHFPLASLFAPKTITLGMTPLQVSIFLDTEAPFSLERSAEQRRLDTVEVGVDVVDIRVNPLLQRRHLTEMCVALLAGSHQKPCIAV
jgi:hypothetical protein